LLLSIDNAHGLHPNYPEKHDENHGPMLGAGPVIKFNANQSYATNSDTSGVLRWLAKQGEELPLQSFVVRADMACGSTIGPITASKMGLKTVDIGVPQFAMHSIRETSAVADTEYLSALASRFLVAAKVVI
jgi:aspartyl aminopeptidase